MRRTVGNVSITPQLYRLLPNCLNRIRRRHQPERQRVREKHGDGADYTHPSVALQIIQQRTNKSGCLTSCETVCLLQTARLSQRVPPPPQRGGEQGAVFSPATPASCRGDSYSHAEVFPTIITCNTDTCLCLILPDGFSTNDKVVRNILPKRFLQQYFSALLLYVVIFKYKPGN